MKTIDDYYRGGGGRCGNVTPAAVKMHSPLWQLNVFNNYTFICNFISVYPHTLSVDITRLMSYITPLH